ncbi:unnamed protein product [Caenorhabditis angaria]|uniref:Fatty acid synthase n=1 Tax=Caenorhabditis angaria TaxID=860376 RepID=A0A9P1J2H4_9PELO|nr:unnamed protein product [Caenorhabditis angaria]
MSVYLVGSWAKIPGGNDALEMAENVFINKDHIEKIPESALHLQEFCEKHPEVKAALVKDIDQFDDQYFGVGESEAIFMDPQQRMLMQGVIGALENAGITIEMASQSKVAVYTAAWAYDYKDSLPPDQYMATGNSASVMCGRITYFLNSRGAAVGIETACSSSLVAFHMARQAILNGETELALVCGANHVGSRSFHSLYNSHMVSPNGRLAAFDRSANGFVRAESFAVAVLCSSKFAIENNLNIHAECIGSAFNSDGKTPSLTAPNPISQHEVQIKAMKTGNVPVDTITMVTCHGTGTKLGDQIELTAIKKSFKPDIRIISPKSSLGHGEGAAGLIGVLQSLYSMSHSIIPNQLHLQLTTEDLGENVSMTFVNEEADLPTVAISSYGFGGTNACAIIKKPTKQEKEIVKYAEANVLFLSAKCEESLKLKIDEYAYFLRNTSSCLEDILYTENTRRTKYDVRAAVYGKSSNEIANKLEEYQFSANQDGDFEIEFGAGNEKLWLLRMLNESNKSFNKCVEKYCNMAKECGITDAETALFYPFKLTLTPLLYNISRLISSMASFELLLEYDCLPNKLRGRGMGQVFCLAVANVITFETAISLISAVIAETDLNDFISQLDFQTARIPIEYQKRSKPTKKVTPLDVIDEIKQTPMPNLMAFIMNGEEISDVDPSVKIQKMLCSFFINGYDPKVNYIGKIVPTPGYQFLKRRFWHEIIPSAISSESKSLEEIDIVEKMSDSELYEKIKEIIQRFLDIEDDDVNLLESGTVDSLTSIEMIEAIGSAVGSTMPFDLLELHPTTKDIIKYLKTVIASQETSRTTKSETQAIAKADFSNSSIDVISSDFMFAGIENEKELWDALMTSKLTTGEMNETRKQQIGGDVGLEVGLLKQDISLFDNAFFSIAKNESEFVDPQHRLLFHSAYNALEKSGLSAIPDADLFLAISSHSEYRAMAESNVAELDERLWMGTVHSMAAGRLAAILGIRGKSILVDTTCSSIASALELAVESIQKGKKYAVVATTQLIQSSKWLYSLRTLLDNKTTKSFSVDGEGFCRSDGVGVIILKRSSNSPDSDIPIITLTSAKTQHSGAVITPVVGVISQLLENAGDYSYIEGHGTATIAGDSAESLAYQKIGRENMIMSSVKAQFGHCEVASGLIQLMKVTCLSKYGMVPAIVHNTLPNEHIRNNNDLRLPFVSEERDIQKSAIVSFGITGTKTLVTTQRAAVTPDQSIKTAFLFPISAKTKDSLKRGIASIMEMLENTNESLLKISKNMQRQKIGFKWRAVAVGKTHEEVVKHFKSILTTDNSLKSKNYHISTSEYALNAPSFFNNIEHFEVDYSSFCNRLRFEPYSDDGNIYHRMAVVFALIKHILKFKLVSKFAVSGFNSLIILAAIDAAPTHYLNDLIHAFVKSDFRKSTLILSNNEHIANTIPLYSVSQYYLLIGKLFEDGANVDFAGIFGKPKEHVALPEYPFNRKSCWLPIQKSKAVQKIEVKNETLEPVQKKEVDYIFELNSAKWKHVRNHVVDNQIVLPGATSIRLVHELHGDSQTTLSNIDFLNKITPDSTPLVIKKVLDDDGVWTLIVGEKDAINYKIQKNHVNNFITIEDIESETKHIDDIYERFSKSQLTYRNQFQMLDSIRFKNGIADAQFASIDNIDILIDGTLQAIVSAFYFENLEDESPYLPFTIDKITIYDDNLAGRILRTVLTYQSSESFVTGNATVYDDEKNIILHIENVSFKRLFAVKASSEVSRPTIKSKSGENETAKREARNMLLIWFEDNFGWTDIDDTVGFFDLGLTSIQAVKLRNHIKSQYPDASSTCVFDHPTVNELSSYLSSLGESAENDSDEVTEDILEDQENIEPPTRLSLNPIGVMSAACRLPGGITCPEELWELLKIGKNASSRIPASRIPTRNNLISGIKYGNPVEELTDPQQRILLECVQECLENSGVTETSNVGVFVGLMEKEYQDMMESSSILSMLGSMAAVIAGRVNYVFGCYGNFSYFIKVIIAVKKVIVAGVNLILNERGQGLRTNGKMLSQHGMSLSFDSRASGYGRSDGCVVLMLELAKPTFRYMSTIQAVNVNHGGRSVSLTAPNGVAHKMLLTSVIKQSPSPIIDYWEAHGTGTPLGDPIEFNTLSSIFSNIIIGSVKASLGHGEASAGTCGLLKLFMMLTHQYVPTLIHFHVLNKDINAGNIRLPIIGEEAELTSAGISSFGVSGTNAASIAFNDNDKLLPYSFIYDRYILPISAKNQISLENLEKEVLSMIPVSDVSISNIASGLANNRNHYTIRNAMIVTKSGHLLSKLAGKPHRTAKKDKYRVVLNNNVHDPSNLQYDFIAELYSVASSKYPETFALKYSLIKFITSVNAHIEIIAQDEEELIAILLADGSISWKNFDPKLLEKPMDKLLNALSDMNLNSNNCMALKNYASKPEHIVINDQIDLLNMIANLYVNGYDIDWSVIYTPVQKYIKLPNYQFNRQSLWYNERVEVFDHYLIGTIEEENEDSITLKNQISELRHPQLFNGKPIDVGTAVEITIEAMKIRNEMPFNVEKLDLKQITLTKPAWLKTVIEEICYDDEDDGNDYSEYEIKAYIDDELLFTMIGKSNISIEQEEPSVNLFVPETVIYLQDCSNAIIRRNRNVIHVDSKAETSPFRTANLVLNEMIGKYSDPSEMHLDIFGVLTPEYYMVQVDDGILWQFQIISMDKKILSSIYVTKSDAGLHLPAVRMHKKSTLLSSQEAQEIAVRTLQMYIQKKVKAAFADVIDSGLEIDESQMSTGFSDLGMDSLATVDLLNRLNQKYFQQIELTNSDLFDNPNVVDLSVRIEELLKEKGIDSIVSIATPKTSIATPKTSIASRKISIRERKKSIPASKIQQIAQIELVKEHSSDSGSIDRNVIKKRITDAVYDLITDSITNYDIETKGFTDLGLDSMSLIDFLNRLNEKYFPGDDITSGDIFDNPSVNELADHIYQKKSGEEKVDVVEKAISVEQETERKLEILDQAFLLIDDYSTAIEFTHKIFIEKMELFIKRKSDLKQMLLENVDTSIISSTGNQILIHLDNFENENENIEYIYMGLLNFARQLTKLKSSCKIGVSKSFSIGNSIARSFLKTVSAEKYPNIEFLWDQKIQQVTFIEEKKPVSGNWLITGGLSGIGFVIGEYLANNGAESVILVSRRQPSTEVLNQIKNWKSKVYTIASDIADKSKMAEELRKLNINVNNFIHSAGVLKDSKIERQTVETFRQVINPKSEGFHTLEYLEQQFGYKIDNFIVMSSFTAACGNDGQLNYGVANAYLEHQIQKRVASGKSGCAMQWGNWLDTGMATNTQVQNYLKSIGFLGQHNEDALKYLRICIEKKPYRIMVANLNWNTILEKRKDLPRDLLSTNKIEYHSGFLKIQLPSKYEEVQKIPEKEVDATRTELEFEDEDDLLDFLKSEIAKLTNTPVKKYKNNSNIMESGLTSNLLMTLMSTLNSSLNLNLNIGDYYNNPVLENLTEFIWENMKNQASTQKKENETKKIENPDFSSMFGVNVFLEEKKELNDIIESQEFPSRSFGNYVVPITAKSIAEAKEKLKDVKSENLKPVNNESRSKSVMMLTGQGSQYPMMGRQLCEHYQIFRNTLESTLAKCDEYLAGDKKLWDILFNTDNHKELQLTKHMQPIMFCFGYSLGKLWEYLGVLPDYYLGHSVGELAAGVLAGIMSIDDGLKLIVERGKAMENIAGLGALLAVQREIADDVLRKFKVVVATLNSPKQVVFAGTKPELDQALAFVKKSGKQGTFVNQMYPFHSNLIQDSHLKNLRKCLAKITFQKAKIPLVSNVSGQLIDSFDQEYIIKHTVSAVKFVNCVETLQGLDVNVWIDAGPAAVLATFVKRIIVPSELSKHRVIQTCKEKDDEIDCVIQSCLELEQAGYNINWINVYGCGKDSLLEENVLEFPISEKSKIDDGEMDILMDHKLNGRVIIAGAYQLFKLVNFVKRQAHGLALKNVKFSKAWYLESGVDFIIDWHADMRITLTVNNEIMCSAKLVQFENSLSIPSCSVEEENFDVKDFYDTLYRNGLQYDDGFRKMTIAKRSDKKCFTDLKSSDYLWPLIDAAMHSITASVIRRRPNCYFLPVAMGTVFIRNQNYDNSKLSGQSWITSENEKFIEVNVVLLSGTEVVCEIRNMTIVVKMENVETPKVQIDDENNEIKIVSFDVTYPFNSPTSSSKNSGWDFLKTNKIGNNNLSGSKVALLDVDQRLWDPEFFNIRPSEAHFLDPQQRLMLTSIAKLLDSAKINLLPVETGVFIGYSTHEFAHVVYAHSRKSPYSEWSSGTATSSIAGRIAYWLKIKGPTITVDTACSSSFSALSLACDSLKNGQCKYAIVGSVNFLMHEMTTNVLSNANMTNSESCKVFDCDADGYKRSEAVSTLLLTNSDDIEKSFGTIKNWCIGHNGTSSSLFTPNGRSQQEIMRKVVANFQNISHFETHCTGTSLGDPIELNSIRSLCKSEIIPVSSIKSNLGHCEGASGIISLCATLEQQLFSYRLPQLHLKYLPDNSRLKINFIGEEIERPDESVVINNFGFTGSNCCFQIDFQLRNSKYSTDDQVFIPILLSSHTKETLQQTIDQFLEFVQNTSNSLKDISFSLMKKKIYRYRIALIFDYRRKIVWRSDEKFAIDDPRIEKIIEDVQVFIIDGKFISTPEHGFLIDLPPIIFKQDVYWKLENYSDAINRKSTINKNLFFEKYLILKASEQLPKSKSWLTYIFKESSVSQFNKLLKFWSDIDPKTIDLVVFGCEANGTTFTEWTSVIKTLASEKLVPFKFVCYERKRQFETELNTSDLYEMIFYKNNERYVERLRKMTVIEVENNIRFDDNLMSGGTGGIGTALMENITMGDTEIITRSHQDLSTSNNNIKYTTGNVTHFKTFRKYENIFHFAGLVNNATHKNMMPKNIEELYEVKVNGARNLLKYCENSFKMASSIGCILGSYGQSNYVFANGLVTSILQKSKHIEFDVIYWGPWKDVGMLAKKECDNINRQLRENGWHPLSTEDALSVFKIGKTESSKREICVFDGDFDIIAKNNEHLRPFLSELSDLSTFSSKVQHSSDFENIFIEVTGIRNLENCKHTPFMDLGIDSLCLETMRSAINRNLNLDITVSDLFENTTFSKLQTFIETLTKNTDIITEIKTPENSESISSHDKIAVIGWSAEFSGSQDIEEFWKNLLEGKICEGKLKNPHTFDNKFFNITDEDAKVIDPQIRKFIEHAYLALEESGYVKQRRSLKCAVFAGAEPTNYGKPENSDDSMRKLFVMNMNNYLASYASYCLDLNGESVSVYSACSTTLVALSHAVQCLKMKQADLALVGAASINNDENDGSSDEKKTLFAASGVCRPFDSKSDGIIRGSGVGCLVLKRLSEAIQDKDDVKFVINDFGISNDGNSRASFMAPNPSGQLKCMNIVLERMPEAEKQRINYVECHATGTVLGDTIELDSLKTAYSFKKQIIIGSSKANIGHSYAASGLASLIKSAMMLKTGIIPPQINFDSFRSDYQNFFGVCKSGIKLPENSLIAIDSFGIGGTNCHMIIEKSPVMFNEVLQFNKNRVLIPISAKSESSLVKITQKMEIKLQKMNEDISMMQNFREEFSFRRIIDVNLYSQKIFHGRIINCTSSPKTCIFFAPQGIQYSNLLQTEYGNNPDFKNEVLKLCKIASKITGRNFEKILYAEDNQEGEIDQPENCQLAILIQEVSLYNFLKSTGIEVDIFVGHSIGEYSAAVCSGVIDAQSILEILYKRTELVQKTEPARMLMIWDNCLNLPSNLEISAIVDENIRCVVGKSIDIAHFVELLKMNHIRYREINTSYGFHSSMLETIRENFENYCQYFDFTTGGIPWISCITGELKRELSSKYCGKHLVEAVNIEKIVESLIENQIDVVIEVGPSGVLEKLLKSKGSSMRVIPTCGSKKKRLEDLDYCFKQLWANGISLNTSKKDVNRNYIRGPGYCFDEYEFTQTSKSQPKNGKKFEFYVDNWQKLETEHKVDADSENADYQLVQVGDKMKSDGIYVFDLIDNCDDLNKPFQLVEHLLKESFKLLIINVQKSTPSTNMVLGLIRCYETVSNQNVVCVENPESLEAKNIVAIAKNTSSNYLKISNSSVFTLKYRIAPFSHDPPNQPLVKNKVIIFGASGFIGNVFCEILEDFDVVRISLENSDVCCDITNYENVENVLASFKNENLKYIINCTGQESSKNLNKSIEDKLKVLSIKTTGNANIIEAIEKLEIHVDKMIICSSLSSIIPIYGNEDYASANCFVDAIPKSTESKFIKSFLSLGLPPIKSSRMYETSNESTKKMMNSISIDKANCVDLLKKVIEYDGTIYISPENPDKIAARSLKHHKGTGLSLKTTSIAQTVSNIWNYAIGISGEVQPSENFFSLGGDSLNALQVVWDIKKETGKDIHVNDIFEHPVFENFVKFISNQIVPVNNNQDEFIITNYDEIPLTNSQTQMFVLRQVDNSDKYNLIFEISINYTNDFIWKYLKHAILTMIAHQLSYRTTFSKSQNQSIHSLTEAYYNFESSLKSSELKMIIGNELNYQFDIGKTIPLRILTIKKVDKIQIIFNQHHILTDGWSMTILANNINKFYNGYCENMDDFPTSFGNSIPKYAIKQSSMRNYNFKEIFDYIGTSNHTSIPVDFNEKTDYKRINKDIPNRLWESSQKIAKLKNVTLYNLILTAFCKTVRSFTAQSDLLFAYADSGRNQDNSNLIGYCMNNILFKCDLSETEDISEKVIEAVNISRKFADIPFHEIVAQRKDLGNISIYFNFRKKLDYPNVSIRGAECEITHISLNNAFDFSFTIDEKPTNAIISLDYNNGKYSGNTMNKFMDLFMKHLKRNEQRKVVNIGKQLDYPNGFMSSVENLETIANINEQFLMKNVNLIREDDLIAIDGDFTTIRACVFTSAAYVPIDREWPEERKKFIGKIVNLWFNTKLKKPMNEKIRFFNKRSKYGAFYTIFTSGSTGIPKGVVISEQSVATFLTSFTKTCLLRNKMRIANSVNSVFDVSVSNIFGSYVNSCELVDNISNSHYAFLPSAVFNSYSKNQIADLNHLETLTIGGESVADGNLSKVPTKVIQIYGPTETCIWSLINSYKKSRSEKRQGSEIGKPIENERCFIENYGIRGELVIRGISVARGYITTKTEHGKVFENNSYSTGDVVDTRNDENKIKYIDRKDNQVKWKGVRIDLSEIENEMLVKLENMLQIKLLIQNQQLIAFFVGPFYDYSHIVTCLKNSTIMPDHFVRLKKMPLNSSGKIDKSILLQAFDQVRKSYKKELVMMKTSAEEKVLNTISTEIGHTVNLNNKFTDVGGNSLSAIQVAYKLSEIFGVEIKAHDILQAENIQDITTKITFAHPESSVSGVITKLREVKDSKCNIYIIHAIGGTILPYYSFLRVFPKNVSLYGIEFNLKYPSNNLRELTQFYAREIAAHAKSKQIFVIGHSMGGIMSREIVEELKMWNYKIPFVMMFDSWVLRTNELDLDSIKKFITYVFSRLQNSEQYIEGALKLAKLLREYKTSVSNTKLYLFKSKQLGEAAFKKAVRSDLNEQLCRSMTCNGFDELSLQPIDTYLINGDHESCLDAKNLLEVKDLILAPFSPYF